MLRSMTGFGRCLVEHPDFTQQWEIKSVNGRHLDLKWRMPPAVRSQEARLEKIVRKSAIRGRVDISLNLQFTGGGEIGCCFDERQAAGMLERLRAFALARGDVFTPDYNRLLAVPGLWSDSSGELAEDFHAMLEEGLILALDDWNEGRATEGQALAADLQSRILRMEEWTALITERAPAIKEERAALLRERLAEALGQRSVELEEARLLQEAAILADRLDVTEELTRLSAHLSRLRSLLRNGEDAGRRLDFTLQECFREINTCGNKIPDVQLSRLMVDFKNELEKCREQVQNLE